MTALEADPGRLTDLWSPSISKICSNRYVFYDSGDWSNGEVSVIAHAPLRLF